MRSLPPLCLHPLDLLNGLLERKAEEGAPSPAALFLAYRTLARMKLLVPGLLPDLVCSNGRSQVPDRGGEIDAALRLNLHPATQSRAELQLQFARGQLAGCLVTAGVVGAAASTDVSGDVVGKVRALGGSRCCLGFSTVAQVQGVEKCVEVLGLGGS